MTAQSQMFGKAKVQADGQELFVDDKSELTLAGDRRHVVKGTRVYGFASEAMEATVKVNVYIGPGTDLDAINAMDDVTILFQADTGQNYVLPHAWLAEPVSAKAAATGGMATLTFNAPTSEQM